MANLRQFSLSYLFLEVFWIAVALMFTTPVIRQEPAWQLSAIIAFSCWGAVIGGFFHAMRDGAIAAFLLFGATLVSYALINPQ
jgi:hypothetical protein